MGIGLVGLIPVLGVTGSLLVAVGLGGETVAWISFVVGLIWIVVMVWWAMRAPAARSEEASKRYWVALRHARFGSQNDVEDQLRRGHS